MIESISTHPMEEYGAVDLATLNSKGDEVNKEFSEEEEEWMLFQMDLEDLP